MDIQHLNKLIRIADTIRSLKSEIQKEERPHLASYKDYYKRQYELVYPILFDDINYQLEFQALKKPENISYTEIKPAFVSLSTLIDSVIKQETLDDRQRSAVFANEYFIEDAKPFSAYKQITSIINQAVTTLKIVDNYVDATSLDFFLAVNTQTKIQILTMKLLPNIPSFIASKKKFLLEWSGNQFEIRASTFFHDRFIIIDDQQVWHLGPSLNKLGQKPMMISMIRDKVIQDAIINIYDTEWTKSTNI